MSAAAPSPLAHPVADNRSPARPRSTIELADGTLVSVYCFANASEINATMAGGAKAKAAPHIGVLRWRLP